MEEEGDDEQSGDGGGVANVSPWGGTTPILESPLRRSAVPRKRWNLRRQRIERCRDETVNALSDFLPTLRRCIEDLTDTSAETRALKALRSSPDRNEHREEERELWESVKVKAVTRMVATAKAHTILFLILSVQVHLLGGRLFEEQMREQDASSSLGADSMASDRMTSYQSSHKLVLTRTYEFFFDKGLGLLVQCVERAVTTVMEPWDVTKPESMHVTAETFNEALVKIRSIVEGRTSRSHRTRSILRFLLPPEHAVGAVVPDDLAQSILDETWDLLESPVFEDAHAECLSATLDEMRERSWEKLFLDSAGASVKVPLALVITKLKGTSYTFYEPATDEGRTGCNKYVGSLQQLPSLLELGSVSFN